MTPVEFTMMLIFFVCVWVKMALLAAALIFAAEIYVCLHGILAHQMRCSIN